MASASRRAVWSCRGKREFLESALVKVHEGEELTHEELEAMTQAITNELRRLS